MDTKPNIILRAGTGTEKRVSAHLIGNIRMSTFNPRSIIFITRMKVIDKKLVHLVLITFNENLTPDTLKSIEDTAYELQQKTGVESLNFGTNVSPEGLGRGYTHSLTMKFSSAVDRDSIYLPHLIHQKFLTLFVPHTESVLVCDF
ncbi:MAG: Dabb family protein [Flavobacteriia bacterium]|nr:Dabb family protein [Flavobacteriia bacterium]